MLSTIRCAKFLYIARDLDEKLASAKLEHLSRQSNIICLFTVVTNAFLGLENTEHTDYDAIFIADNLHTLKAYEFLKVLRTVGASVPVVYLLSRQEDVQNAEIRGLPATGFEKPTANFSAVLRTPYSCHDLCDMIRSIFFRHGAPADSHGSEEDDVRIESHPFDTPFSPFPYALSNTNTNTNTNSGVLEGAHLMDFFPGTMFDQDSTGTGAGVASATNSAALAAIPCSSQTPSRSSVFGPAFRRSKQNIVEN